MKFLQRIIKETINSILPDRVIKNSTQLSKGNLEIKDVSGNITYLNLSSYKNIYLISTGKAASLMAFGMKDFLSDKIRDGIVVTKYGFEKETPGLKTFTAGHPVPDSNGLDASKKVIELLKNTGKNDLIIFLISGGSSSLLPLPAKGINLDDKIKTTELLLKCGASINEINDIRTFLSDIKGGKILKYTYPSDVFSLVISDVIGDNFKHIGSGLTALNQVTRERVYSIFEKYNIKDELTVNVKEFIASQSSVCFSGIGLSKAKNILIGNNLLALKKLKEFLEAKEFKSKIITNRLSGEAKEVGRVLAREAIKLKRVSDNKLALLFGGETTVTVNGNGKGGRNQELALAAAIELDGHKDITLISFGTDGNDGPTDAAGAIVNGNTVKKALSKNLVAKDFLLRNDSYNFFDKLDLLIKTGPTFTNMMDIQIVLINYTI